MPLGLDPDDPRVRSAALAELVREFWLSPIGQYLKQRAQEQAEEATKKLVLLAHKLTMNDRLCAQTEIWRAEKFVEWLGEAYEAGMADLKILEEEHDEHGN